MEEDFSHGHTHAQVHCDPYVGRRSAESEALPFRPGISEFLRSSPSTSHKSLENLVASLPVLAFGVRLFRLDQYISTHARARTCTHPCTHGRDTSRPTHAHTGVGGDVDNEHGRDCLPGASGTGRNGFNGSEPGRRPCILTRTRGEHRRVHVRRYAPQQHHGRRTALVRFALV